MRVVRGATQYAKIVVAETASILKAATTLLERRPVLFTVFSKRWLMRGFGGTLGLLSVEVLSNLGNHIRYD